MRESSWNKRNPASSGFDLLSWRMKCGGAGLPDSRMD